MIMSMNSGPTDIMATQRLTVSMPWYLYNQVKTRAVQGNVSQYVVAALKKKVGEEIVASVKRSDPWEEFLALRKVLPKMSGRQIRVAINKGRR